MTQHCVITLPVSKSHFYFTLDKEILVTLRNKGVLVKTPSGNHAKKSISCYDDRFILKLATEEKAVVVSNDQFRDLRKEGSYKETIQKRILPFTFVNDR